MQGEVAMRFLYLAPDWPRRCRTELRVVEVAPLLRELILHILTAAHVATRPTRSTTGWPRLLVDLLLRGAPRRPRPAAAERPRGRSPSPTGCWPPRTTPLAWPTWRAAPARPCAPCSGCSRRETGLTLEAWRQKARMIAGAAALSGGAPVAVTAADCGYESPSAFITAFKRAVRRDARPLPARRNLSPDG